MCFLISKICENAIHVTNLNIFSQEVGELGSSLNKDFTVKYRILII